MKKDIYEIYTEQIIALLESGTAPWRKPWAGGAAGMPRNLKTGKAYRGINTLMLALRGYASPNWLTFKQAKELGGKVRKGEKSTIVLFFNWIYKTADGKRAKSAADAATKHGFYKYYRVFNIEQIDGIESPEPVKPVREHEAIAECEAVVDNMPQRPVINHGGGRAYYRPSTDAVQMPPADTFGSGEGYYCVLFHELGHSTGHEKRLARKGITESNSFGSADYSREELVAEMTACFLCGHTGIAAATIDNSAAYLANWIKALKGDHKLAITAGAQAQKAADFILNVKHG